MSENARSDSAEAEAPAAPEAPAAVDAPHKAGPNEQVASDEQSSDLAGKQQAEPGSGKKRRGWLYLVGMLGFFGFMWVTSQWGNTNSMWGFQRRINIRLQQIERGIFYDNRAEGLIVAKGEGVFQFLDLHEIFERFQEGGMTIDQAAEEVAADVTRAREFAGKLSTWENLKPKIIALPVARKQIHPLLEQGEAASSFVIARGPYELPFYTFYYDQYTPPTLLTRAHLSMIVGTPSVREVADLALSNSKRNYLLTDETTVSKAWNERSPILQGLAQSVFEINAPLQLGMSILAQEDFVYKLRSSYHGRLKHHQGWDKEPKNIFIMFQPSIVGNGWSFWGIKSLDKEKVPATPIATVWSNRDVEGNTIDPQLAYHFRFSWRNDSAEPQVFYRGLSSELGALAKGSAQNTRLFRYYPNAMTR